MEEPLSPEEFARLMSLPADHPDRVRAATTPEFAALSRMWSEFESGGDRPGDPGDVEGARAELRRRFERTLASSGPASADARLESEAMPDSGSNRGWVAVLFSRPAGRMGLAFAVVALVAGLARWWNPSADRGGALRGDSATTGFALSNIRTAPGALLLEWRPESGADAYRITFLGPDLGEIARLDDVRSTEIAIRSDALPAGLKRGQRVAIEIVALQGGDSLAHTPARSARIP